MKQDYQSAISYYRKAINQIPKLEELYYALTLSHLCSGDNLRATVYYVEFHHRLTRKEGWEKINLRYLNRVERLSSLIRKSEKSLNQFSRQQLHINGDLDKDVEAVRADWNVIIHKFVELGRRALKYPYGAKREFSRLDQNVKEKRNVMMQDLINRLIRNERNYNSLFKLRILRNFYSKIIDQMEKRYLISRLRLMSRNPIFVRLFKGNDELEYFMNSFDEINFRDKSRGQCILDEIIILIIYLKFAIFNCRLLRYLLIG